VGLQLDLAEVNAIVNYARDLPGSNRRWCLADFGMLRTWTTSLIGGLAGLSPPQLATFTGPAVCLSDRRRGVGGEHKPAQAY
jgi:hypothetical protein